MPQALQYMCMHLAVSTRDMDGSMQISVRLADTVSRYNAAQLHDRDKESGKRRASRRLDCQCCREGMVAMTISTCNVGEAFQPIQVLSAALNPV